ncbi:MAG: cbb3-type cytochrome oxidase assembly protein CcoS [Paracoccaceae bacterium]|nr:cbb3-type cytochrome oxidase assembly protein CcoS [Paracoccaceae bacterium]
MNWFYLIPISIGLGLTGLGAFFWALRHDQYDDLEGAAARILVAPDTPAPTRPTPPADPASRPRSDAG